ncbi:MAG: hypothetical protein L6R35_006337, partial [Caloplaca aegaea]
AILDNQAEEDPPEEDGPAEDEQTEDCLPLGGLRSPYVCIPVESWLWYHPKLGNAIEKFHYESWNCMTAEVPDARECDVV